MRSDPIAKELIRDEGIRFRAYKDSLGYWTIGIGHLLGDTARMTSITEAECEALFNYDLHTAMKTVGKLFGYRDDIGSEFDVRDRVLINMAFNLGEERLGKFKRLIDAVKRRDWAAAAVSMRQSLWAKQVGDRAVRLIHMMETGTPWPDERKV